MGTLPTRRVVRTYYRNGVVATEGSSCRQAWHGPVRQWHRNGQLASEERYERGLLHGLCRQWREDGKLLGSYRMTRGTGIQRLWYEDGTLHLEHASVNGRLNGRSRSWLRDGTLLSDDWLLDSCEVSRAEYFRAARQHPEWPASARTPSRPLRLSPKQREARFHDLHCKWLLSRKGTGPAKGWLESGDKSNRFLGSLGYKKAVALIAAAEDSGAKRVLAVDVYKSKSGQQFADGLLVRMPRLAKHRAAIRGLFLSLPMRARCVVLPEKDSNKPWLWVYLG